MQKDPQQEQSSPPNEDRGKDSLGKGLDRSPYSESGFFISQKSKQAPISDRTQEFQQGGQEATLVRLQTLAPNPYSQVPGACGRVTVVLGRSVQISL